jgi:enoyl-CoA hydratase/carnithine racemase
MSPFTGSAGFTERWRHFGYGEEAGVATVTFDRPERLNALTFEVYADLRDLLAELPNRDGVRVLVLTGNGRGFCSGGDVHDIIGMTGAVVQRLRELPLPVVAAVNGVAAGAGAVIALAADLRLLARSASLQFLFTRVGLSGADMGCAYLLPRLVGLGRATELLLLGDRVDADRAVALGLANRVVDDPELPAATAELARRLADGPALAYAATKVLLGRELDLPLSGALELEAVTQALLLGSEDHREFYAAFTEGRSPAWKGR